jgi:hypothetical protein
MKSIVSQTNSVFVYFDYFDLLSLYIFMTRTHRHLFHSKDVCPPPPSSSLLERKRRGHTFFNETSACARTALYKLKKSK